MKYPSWKQAGYFCFWADHINLNPHVVVMFHSILTSLGISLDAFSILNHILALLDQIRGWLA